MSRGWSWPTTGRINDEFGWRVHPIYGDRRLHRGCDMSVRKNDPIRAAAVGVVSWAGYNGGEGNSVHIDHPDGSRTKYFHNTSLNVVRGQSVSEGDVVSFAGTTGASTGVHLHYETHDYSVRDSPVDPRGFMDFRGAPYGSEPAYGGSTPINTDEQDLEMGTPEIQASIEAFRQQAVGNQDKTIKPALVRILELLTTGQDQQTNRILDAIRRESRPRLYQINQPGHPKHTLAAAIDIDEGYFRPFGSLKGLQNAIRLQEVAPETPQQITAAEFFEKEAAAKARLDELDGLALEDLGDLDLGTLLPFTEQAAVEAGNSVQS